MDDEGTHSQTNALISDVIRLTEEQYEKHQQKANGKFRASCQKIINAALSFKDIISAVAAFDPTQHAASAWTIVSLGLTVTKNYSDLRDALFESSEYLADVLAQCAFIEKNFYLNSNVGVKDDLGNAMVRLYRAILYYTAQIRKAQDPSMGRKLLDCVTAITEHPLTELRASVEKERDNIFRWIGLVRHLCREKEAEIILCQIDKLTESMKHLIEQFGLVNLRVAEGAFYDSYINEHEDFCLPDTRTELHSRILDWADSTEGHCIFWLNGMAGTGKSTIARTVARSFKDKGQLGATFFFKRGEADRGNARYLISTIMRQLITRHRQLVPDVLNAIENDPNISSKFLSEQFDKLLLKPLLKLRLNQPTTTVIVIDALDECDREDDIQVILRLLFRLQNFQSVHLRVFLTSRPELPIRLVFKQNNNHQNMVLHELPKPVIEHDIRLFLEHKLAEIRDDRSLPPDWPGNETIGRLVKMAVPLFIFAATICRFVGERKWRPEKRLEAILHDHAASSAYQMDRTYLPVLNQLLCGSNDREIEQLKQEFQDIVGVIILLATPLPVNALAQLIDSPRDDISNRLDGFHSVLHVPENINSPIRILHLSFRDYLVNRDSSFYVDEKETHGKITSHCLRVMDTTLKRNICGLPSYGTQRMDIESQVINQHLTAALEYSCRYWVYHLKESKGGISQSEILSFLKRHFLHWLEALSLTGMISEAVGIIDTLDSAIWRSMGSEFSDFLYNAKRFTLKYAYIAKAAPLQLYCSSLVFSPMQNTIRKVFANDIPKWLHTLPQVEDSWSPALQTLEGHLYSVQSVAFSPDGQILASGSIDSTIKLWDIKTGTELQILKEHSSSVQSVAFSPDGQTLASGSEDDTIKIWDAKTGTELQTLKGHHTYYVQTVAFSPDGRTLASGHDDQNIKIWDAKTGSELQTLKGHSSSIRSVAFSPDGQTLASGSDDHTTKIWDTKTGTELQTLKGHSSFVQAVAFSPDGQTLASGSDDHTTKIWDAKTGTELRTLKGHLGPIQSVAFSPDGQILASGGSSDEIIKIWDVKAGTELQTLEGHSNYVKSVAFSPDGRTLASGSDDKTINIWDAKTATELRTPGGHSSYVQSMAFSPDGQTLASGSDDKTIKIWDAKSGTELLSLKGHSDLVRSVAFSPDGQILASGSDDKTIKIWDAETATELQTLKGHSDRVQSVVFSSDGQTLASGSSDEDIKIWDAKSGTELLSLKGHSNYIRSVAFSPDGHILASGSNDKTIKIWDAKTGTELRTLKGHSDRVQSVAFSPDGKILASGSSDETIKIWDAKSGTELQTLKGHTNYVRSVDFLSDGQTLVSGSDDKTIKTWDIKTGTELQTLKGHQSASVSQLAANMGYTGSRFSSIPQLHDNCDSTSHLSNSPVSSSDDWLALAGENVLWLPPEYRRFSCFAFKDATIAMGYYDGRVSIIGFHAP
ncbi:hypothetical protein BDV12DRAFT_203139 [Aspergillus spectabilis]